MHWFERLHIASKLSVMVISVIVIFSLLSGGLLLNELSRVMLESLESRGRAVASEIASLGSEPIQTGNLFALDELVYVAKKNNEFIEYIFIVDQQQQVMAHTFAKGMPKNLLGLNPPENLMDRHSNVVKVMTSRGWIQDIIYPIEDGTLGYVRIGINEKSLQQLITNNIFKFVIIILTVVLVGSFFVFRLTHNFTKPIEKLMLRAENISAGRLSDLPLPVHSEDEFGRLTAAMNKMEASLRSSELERMGLLRRLLAVQESERKRISMELHDESGQAITAIMLSMRALANRTDDKEIKEYILDVCDETAHILKRLRNLAVELRPPALDHLGVEAAIEKLISDYQKFYNLKITFLCQLNQNPDDVISLALYRIVQECLTNIVKHANASKVFIHLKEDDVIRLWIKDDGVGITQDQIIQARKNNHLGIYGIGERVRLLGGVLKVLSEKPEWSTVFKIEISKKGRMEDEHNDSG